MDGIIFIITLFQFDSQKDKPSLHVLTYVINWSSVVMNPIIYVATQSKYRVAIKILCLRIRYHEDRKFFTLPVKF